MTIAIISHPDCALHFAGAGHPESPERFEVVQNACQQFSFTAPTQFYEAPFVTREQLIAAHDSTYVDWIFSIAPKKKSIMIDEDTIMSPHTLNAAQRAAGAVCFAVDCVIGKSAQVAFCNVRPPGHHAEREKAMGFCFFNNMAVGVRHAMSTHGLQRVAIIDFDVHHGNGTQNIFQRDKKVLYCSSFQHPFYPGYDSEMDNEHILSVPLRAGTDGKLYRESVEKAWFGQLAAFQPELIFFSAGFDAYEADPIGQLKLNKDDYVWLTKQIAKIAKVHAKGRMISVLEGGYNLEGLKTCVPAHVEAMV